jgi:hypothetical protein
MLRYLPDAKFSLRDPRLQRLQEQLSEGRKQKAVVRA